jgi:hypothetical protein
VEQVAEHDAPVARKERRSPPPSLRDDTSATSRGSDVRSGSIVLKKSDFTRGQYFAEALVRSSENYVGDRITNPIFSGKSPQVSYKALDC